MLQPSSSSSSYRSKTKYAESHVPLNIYLNTQVLNLLKAIFRLFRKPMKVPPRTIRTPPPTFSPVYILCNLPSLYTLHPPFHRWSRGSLFITRQQKW